MKPQASLVVLVMTLSFAATVAVLLYDRRPAATAMPPPPAHAGHRAPAMVRAASTQEPVRDAPRATTNAAAVTPVSASSSAIENDAGVAPKPDAADLPVEVHFRRRADLQLVQGSVVNHSSSELAIDALIFDPGSNRRSKVLLDVPPYSARTFGVDDGLDLQAGNRVTLQSAPYRDLDTRIP